MDTERRLLADQAELRDLARQLAEATLQETPPDRATMSALRWHFARALLRHLPMKDRLVYARLRLHADPAVAATARRFSEEASRMYDGFAAHSDHWTPARVESEWTQYSAGVRQMVAMLAERITREETDLLPHLATAPNIPPTRSPGDRNWAGDGWRLRAQFGID